KCSYQRAAGATGDPGICGGCGLVFAKWVSRQSGIVPARPEAPADTDADATDEAPANLGSRLRALVFDVPERTDPILFWGRAALYVAIFIWGWYFILLDFRTNDIGRSFVHNIDLVFHE